MRMGSIGLLYGTQIRAPHRSHSQLNDGVDGIGTWSTRGQVSTSPNSKSSMHIRYTRNLFELALNPPAYPHTTIAIPPTAYRGADSSRVTSAGCADSRSDLGGEKITFGTAQDSRASVTRLTQALNE
jgi:hypothetical protein